MFGSRDTNFRLFLAKIGIFGANSSRTEIYTAKPMVVGCVQHYSTHFIKKVGKSSEPFFHKVQKNAKKGQKGSKRGILAKSAIFTKKGPHYVQALMDA